MDIFGKFKPVTEADLYDFYGIASLDQRFLNDEERKLVEFTLTSLKQTYMEALRKRFAHWAPNGGQALSVEAMIKTLRDSITEEVGKQADKMARMGAGFNMMAAVKQMRGETEEAKKKAEVENTKTFAKNLSSFDKDRYQQIAKGVIEIYEAKTPQAIIMAIDHLNDLQHWGGYILIDFVAGHRDPSDPEGNRVLQNILEIKKNAKNPLEFADKMTTDVRKLVQDDARRRRAGII